MLQQEQLARGSCLALPSLLSAGNLKGTLACLSRDACLLTPDGTSVHGREAIAPVFAQLIASRMQAQIEFSKLLVAGDAAVAYQKWSVSRDGVNGSRVSQDLHPTLFLQRVEGSWKLAIVLLWGLGGSLQR